MILSPVFIHDDTLLWLTMRESNIDTEYGPFIDDIPITTSIDRVFSSHVWLPEGKTGEANKTLEAHFFSGIYAVYALKIDDLCSIQENGHDVSEPAAEPKVQADWQICGQRLHCNGRQNRFSYTTYII